MDSLISKGKIEKDDVDAMIDLQSDLLAIQTQCKNSKMEEELDRQDIVRDIVMKRLPFMSDEFYRRETKRQKKDPKFRMKFDDLLEAIEDRARTLKAQGVSSKKESARTANVAATTTERWSDKAASPPKKQIPASECFNCNSLQHGLDKCNVLLQKPLAQVAEIIKKDGRCFGCLEVTKDHVAKFCKNKRFKCEKDGMNHPTILCGLPKLLAEQRQQKSNDQERKTGNNRPANNRPNTRPANSNGATGNGPQTANNSATSTSIPSSHGQVSDTNAQNNASGSQGDTRQNINNI